MVFDSISSASIPTAASNAKDFAKKKRANRSAKLKQCKLDARREQWLSQVKNKGYKEESKDEGKFPIHPLHAPKDRGQSVLKLEIDSRGEESEGLMQHYSDWDSPSNSPTSHTSSVLGSKASGTDFTGSSRSISSSGGSFSGSVTEEEEEEEGDGGCLDDWEAVADALAATENKQEHVTPHLVSSLQENTTQLEAAPVLKPDYGGTIRMATKAGRVSENCRAWRPDDAFRPQSLPNLVKHNNFPMNTERHYGRAAMMTPSSCPICCEDLDFTDSSFLPCSCGFRLCLFCHKRILEEDGRCPGCRKQYDQLDEGDATIQSLKLGRSCSMISRS